MAQEDAELAGEPEAEDAAADELPVGRIVAGMFALLLAGVTALGAVLWSSAPAELPDVGAGAHLVPVALELPEFSLVDQTGAEFDRSRLEGHWSLLFFGYASCPDVCPTTLQSLARIRGDLQPSESVQVIFVSVDPERDSVERLRDYVGFFHPEFEGVTGDAAELRRLTRALGVHHERREPSAGAEGYLVDHSSSLFLIDPDARLHALLDDPRDPAAFLDALRRVRAVSRGPS